jgi:integrase
MARIKIEHVEFRGKAGDQPRFKPSPSLVKLGFKARRLCHPDGRWFNAAEVLAYIDSEILPEVARRRQNMSAARPARGAQRFATIGSILETYIAFKRDRHAPKTTLKDYTRKARAIEVFDPEFYAADTRAVTHPGCYRLYLAMAKKRGLATAVGAIRVLSAAFGHALRTGAIEERMNPCQKMRMETPPPRVRAGSVDEMTVLIAAADHLGRGDVRTMIKLGLWTGQRQGDRREMVLAAETGTRVILRQSKTGAIVSIPVSAFLVAALEDAKAIKRGLKFRIIDQTVSVNIDTGRKWCGDTYRHQFAAVRALAVKGFTDSAGIIHPPCPSLAGFTDADLRDTAVTWLARSGCDLFEVASITGHELKTVHTILRHYLADHPERADTAIAKMTAWYSAQIEQTVTSGNGGNGSH